MLRGASASRPGILDESPASNEGIIIAVAVLVAVLEDGGQLKAGEFGAAMRKVLASLDEHSSLSQRHVIERFIELFEFETTATLRS